MTTRILIGDCIESMKSLPSGSVDAIITDPPYGTTACKWDTVIPFEPMWEQLKRIAKKNAAIVLFGSEPFSSLLRCSNLKMYKYDWIWNKKKGGNIFNLKHSPYKTHEIISVFSKAPHNYYPIMTPRHNIKKSKNYGTGEAMGGDGQAEDKVYEYKERYPTSIQVFSNAVQKGKLHPTQKPTALLEYLVRTYTNEGDTVLDFTMGSGTTGVACEKNGRNFVGIELDPEYAEIARKRIEAVKYIPKAKVLPRYREQDEVRRKAEQLEMFK